MISPLKSFLLLLTLTSPALADGIACNSNCTTVYQEPPSPLSECTAQLLASVTAYDALLDEARSLEAKVLVCKKPPVRETITPAAAEAVAAPQPRPPRKIIASRRHRRASDCKRGRTRNARGRCGIWH